MYYTWQANPMEEVLNPHMRTLTMNTSNKLGQLVDHDIDKSSQTLDC